MADYHLVFTKRAKKDIEALPSLIKDRISKALDWIAADPFTGKALKGELKGLYSYRMGSYRIIYQIHKEEILVIVLKIGHRREIYRQ